MKDVFISYNSQKYEVAETIRNYLESNGITCFFDKRDMKGGKRYGGELVEAIENCHVQLFLFSNFANENPKNVLSELEIAWDSDIPCFTIMLDDAKPIKDIKFYIKSCHLIECFEDDVEMYLPKIVDDIKELLPEKEEIVEEVEEKIVPTTKLCYDPVNGCLINEADGERNVSFRTKTFINMMGGIYEKVSANSNEEIAQQIFFESGYTCGKNFANSNRSTWERGNTIAAMKKNIKKWCAFDSVVGWGKFEADINIDEENDNLEGTLTITEAFIVDTENKRKVCAFIRGYCTGVLNTLLNNSEVELTCRSCPLEKKFNCKCVFDVKMKG